MATYTPCSGTEVDETGRCTICGLKGHCPVCKGPVSGYGHFDMRQDKYKCQPGYIEAIIVPKKTQRMIVAERRIRRDFGENTWNTTKHIIEAALDEIGRTTYI